MTAPPIAFFDIPYHSRLVTTLPIVRALVARGHAVHGFTLPPYRDLLLAAGAEVVLQPALAPEPPDCTVNLRTIDYSLTAVPEIVEELRRIKPQLVVYTAKCLWAAIAAERCGIPSAVLHTNALLPRGATVSAAVYAARWPEKSEAELAQIAARDHAAWAVCADRFHLRGISVEDVLPTMPNCMSLRGDLNLVYTSEELQPRRGEFDASYHFVGPCYDLREVDRDLAFEAALRALPRPIIYAALGSMRCYNDKANVYETLLRGFASSAQGLVLAVGSAEAAAGLGAPPSQVLLRPYVPQLTALQHAALFITHAGTNSVFESLLAGVPMIMVPQGGDQPIMAEHIQARGLGHWLAPTELGTPALRERVAAMLADTAMLERVRAAGETLRKAGGVARAVTLLSEFARQSPLSSGDRDRAANHDEPRLGLFPTSPGARSL